MNIGRRHLLQFAGGITAGAFLTPMPWKLVSDSALWSQNWSWIPKLPIGEAKVKYTSCTLCPAGCGVKARCIGDQPVGLVGVAGHPLSQGTLCALGVGAHHLPYHPRRVSMPLKRGADGKHVPASLETVTSEIARTIKMRDPGESVAILDERPGRTQSWIYRRWLAGVADGIYVTPPDRERATLAAVGSILGQPETQLGFDIAHTGALISFGAPILDGWGIPAQVNAARRRGMKLVQVETRQSRTASLADVWLAVKPGTETVMALGIANVILAGQPASGAADAAEYAALVKPFTPEAVSATTGVPAETIVSTAHLLAGSNAVAVGGGDPGGGLGDHAQELAVAGLNLLLGAVGREGGILARQETPVPDEWRKWELSPQLDLQAVPDHSIAVLLLGDCPSGDALPWSLILRKLVTGRSTVVSLAPYAEGSARHADYIVPAPAFLEALEEVPAPPTATTASMAVAAPLLKPPTGSVDPNAFLSRLAGEPIDLTERLKQRVAAIHSTKHGEVFAPDGAASKPVTDFKDAGELWTAMLAGAVWSDNTPGAKLTVKSPKLGAQAIAARVHVPDDAAFPLTLMPYAWRGSAGTAALPPLLTKVYQESHLRASGRQCRIHPDTASASGIHEGDRIVLETRCGSCEQSVWVDASVMPGIVEVPAGPPGAGGDSTVLDACGLDADCTWRISRARVRRLS